MNLLTKQKLTVLENESLMVSGKSVEGERDVAGRGGGGHSGPMG